MYSRFCLTFVSSVDCSILVLHNNHGPRRDSVADTTDNEILLLVFATTVVRQKAHVGGLPFSSPVRVENNNNKEKVSLYY